jgi:hypothetical protein
MADKKEVSILLLGIVAILAIVGLVLLFTSPAAIGNMWMPPPMAPEVQAPYPPGGVPVVSGGQYGMARGQIGNAYIVHKAEAANLPRCPNGALRELGPGGNLVYEAAPEGYECTWWYCSAFTGTDTEAGRPVMACVQK